VLFGAHVSTAGGLLSALGRAEAIGADLLQVHTQSPRAWRPAGYPGEVLAEYAAAVAAHRQLQATICHASYLINLATGEEELLERSRSCLVTNLEVATRMGARGLVLHVGSHRGAGFHGVLAAVASELSSALDKSEATLGAASCRLLLENTAGAGGTIGRSFEELAELVEACGDDRRLGVCLDTQHLFASGVCFESLEEADAVVDDFDRTIGLDRLGCIHLNDSKVPLGTNRDRHENLGEGHIGTKALGSLLSHPALQAVPAVLEVPGPESKGPGSRDIRTARLCHQSGTRRRAARSRRAAPPATRPPRPEPRPEPGGRRGSRPGRPPAGWP
jgi:deoxyribonuclease-4